MQIHEIIKAWQAMPVQAAKQSNSIDIFDFIGSGFFEEGFTDKRMSAALRSIGENQDIVVNINSPGGDVSQGIAIYEMLKAHKGKVEVRILGVAASIASIIALAGDEIKISEAGLFMVHDAWAMFAGNASAMREIADYLDKTSDLMAEIYAKKTKKDKKYMRELMQAGKSLDGTYLRGQEAVDMGFADGLLQNDKKTKPKINSALAARLLERGLKQEYPEMTRSEIHAEVKEIFNGVSDSAAEAVSDSGNDRLSMEAAKLELALALYQYQS